MSPSFKIKIKIGKLVGTLSSFFLGGGGGGFGLSAFFLVIFILANRICDAR